MALARSQVVNDEAEITVSAADGAIVALGARGDAAATTDTGAFSLIALVKRGLQHATSLMSGLGAPTDAAASSDAGAHSLISLIKRLLEKITSGIRITQQQWSVVSAINGATLHGVAKASPGALGAFNVVNYATSTRYLQFFDRATALSGGEVPTRQFPIPLGAPTAPTIMPYGNDFFGLSGEAFSVGIVWAISTTSGVYTPPAANTDCDVQVRYQ